MGEAGSISFVVGSGKREGPPGYPVERLQRIQVRFET